MGYQFQYLEKNIIAVQWLEKVTIEELEIGVQQVSQRIDEAGDVVYVEIVDLKACKAIPFDLRGLRRISTFDSRLIGYVIVNINLVAKTMANMLIEVTQLPFRVAPTFEEAVVMANKMVSEHTSARL